MRIRPSKPVTDLSIVTPVQGELEGGRNTFYMEVLHTVSFPLPAQPTQSASYGVGTSLFHFVSCYFLNPAC